MDEDEYRTGLVAVYQDRDGHSFRRVDGRITLNWVGVLDRRLTRPATIRWSGRLMSQGKGNYRLAALVHGAITVKLNGKTLLRSDHSAQRAATVREGTWNSSIGSFLRGRFPSAFNGIAPGRRHPSTRACPSRRAT